MQIIKRNGKKEEVKLDKILLRVQNQASDLKKVDPVKVAQKVVGGLFDGISSSKIDDLLSQTSHALTDEHPDYSTLAARIAISALHKETKPSFYHTMKEAYKEGVLSDEFIASVKKYQKDIEKVLDHDRDFVFDYFGFKTLANAYLIKVNKKVIERPQHLFMRVALAVSDDNWTAIKESYDYFSKSYYTHATPTLFNAGYKRPQYASCFLLKVEDSIDGIFDAVREAAQISKYSGGIGMHATELRSQNSKISGNNGISNGIVPWMKIFNETARAVNQCFTPNTLVYTKSGIKPIEQIVIGDQILSKDGQYHNIERVISGKHAGSMIKIQASKAMDAIMCTPEHPFFVIKNEPKEQAYSRIIGRLERKEIKAQWIDAKDLELDDLLITPIPQYEQDLESYSLEDCRFYGMMLGDGHITQDGSECGLSLGTDKAHLIDFALSYLKLNHVHAYVSKPSEHKEYVQIRWSNTTNFKFKRNFLYDSNKEKRVDSSMLHLPRSKVLMILQGLLDTDGHVGEKEIQLQMTSKSVIEATRYWCLKMGVLTSGYEREPREAHVTKHGDLIESKKNSFTVRIPWFKEICELYKVEYTGKFKFFRYEDMLYSRIDSIETAEYEGMVYDFDVNQELNYLIAHGGIVHNGGKRPGSIAVYLEPWHADVEAFLELKKKLPPEEIRAKDLFLAMWCPSLFFERCEKDENWSLFCPKDAVGLIDAYGEKFNELYAKYEASGIARKTMKARDLFAKIVDVQISHSGVPYMLNKDMANMKSNQKNLGTIRSSNLCTEIIQYSDDNETAVCNLSSLILWKFVHNGTFNFDKLEKVVRKMVRNLNNVIDRTFYPTEKTRVSNLKHRPMGLGVQGLTDVFNKLHMPFDSEQAINLDKQIFATIYFAAVSESVELSKKHGPYESFKGSPASEGILQYHMWNETPDARYDWKKLEADVVKYGIRNSLFVAPMPTASTAQIHGSTEAFEPIKGIIFKRETSAGDFYVVNRDFVKEMEKRGLWNTEIKNKILANNGSIRGLMEVPEDIREQYKCAHEISQRWVIDHAAARGVYVDQSQSMNLFFENVNVGKVSSALMYGYKKGLKTLSYYIRTDIGAKAVKVGLEDTKKEAVSAEEALACSIDNPEDCEVCSS